MGKTSITIVLWCWDWRKKEIYVVVVEMGQVGSGWFGFWNISSGTIDGRPYFCQLGNSFWPKELNRVYEMYKKEEFQNISYFRITKSIELWE